MIASGYLVHLYCDFKKGQRSCELKAEFSADTRAEVRKLIRDAGWWTDREFITCLCDEHNTRGNRP